jgi:hypothetical protein
MKMEGNNINKLVVIGNGFDLSLGLKTKYQDFLLWLFESSLIKALDEKLKKIPVSIDKQYSSHIGMRVKGFHENELLVLWINPEYQFNEIELREKNNDLQYYISCVKKSGHLRIIIKSELLNKCIDSTVQNWVDIEACYFELLKKALYNYMTYLENEIRFTEQERPKMRNQHKNKVSKLNLELIKIGEKLKEYLKHASLLVPKDKSITKHVEIFEKNVNDGTYGFFNHQVCLLNFNYTHTVSKLCEESSFIINHIHGALDEEIIFGYGDEMDKAYKEMEELNENSFFEHIKSFGYFRNDRYRQLLGFMASGKFQVGIYGHSCGLSDRVLLNEIFEHENCHSIRVYHMGYTDYINKTMEISRHFNSNKLLRNRILPYNPEDFIPQKSEV